MYLDEEGEAFRNLAKYNKNRDEHLFNLCFRAMDTQTQITYKPKKVSLQTADAIITVKWTYPLLAEVFSLSIFGINIPQILFQKIKLQPFFKKD